MYPYYVKIKYPEFKVEGTVIEAQAAKEARGGNTYFRGEKLFSSLLSACSAGEAL